VPLVASASIAHLLFGEFQLGLTASILVGALPGVFFGALLSSKAPDHLIRPALVIVLLASSLKLLGASNGALGLSLGAVLVVALGLWVRAHFKRRAASASKHEEVAPSPL
jgi:uncharacterized protein